MTLVYSLGIFSHLQVLFSLRPEHTFGQENSYTISHFIFFRSAPFIFDNRVSLATGRKLNIQLNRTLRLYPINYWEISLAKNMRGNRTDQCFIKSGLALNLACSRFGLRPCFDKSGLPGTLSCLG